MVLPAEFLQDLHSQRQLDRPTRHRDGKDWLVIARPIHWISGDYCCYNTFRQVAPRKRRQLQVGAAAVRNVLSSCEEHVADMARHG